MTSATACHVRVFRLKHSTVKCPIGRGMGSSEVLQNLFGRFVFRRAKSVINLKAETFR